MRDLAFSPAGDLLIASFMGGGTRIWSTDSGKEVGALPGSSPSSTRRFTRPNLGEEPRSIAVSARSDRLAIAEGEGTLVLGELSTLAEVGRIELGEEILDVDFRSEDDHLAALVRDAEGQRISVRIVDPESAVAQTLLTREYRREGRGWLSPDGSKAALLCDATLAFQDTRGGPVTEMMMGGMTPPHALAWVDANRVIVSDRAEVRLLEVVDPVHRVLEATGDATRCVNVAPDGSTVAAVGSDDLIQLWNLDTRDEPRAFRTDQGRTAVAFSPDGTKMASVGSDGSLALWSSADGRSLGRWAVSSSLLETVVFCPGGKMVATAGEAGVGLWNLEDGSGHVNGELSSVTHVAVDPAGRRLATASDQAILAVWDAETLELLNHQVIPRRRFGWTAGFSSDGRRIVYATDADQVIVVDSETLEPVLECESSATESSGKQTGTFKTIFSPDGERILATWQTGRHRIFDARTGRHVLSLDTRRHGSYGSLDFSADGMVLAIAGPGRTVDVWDLRR
jgi:WD40 repeat protein